MVCRDSFSVVSDASYLYYGLVPCSGGHCGFDNIIVSADLSVFDVQRV